MPIDLNLYARVLLGDATHPSDLDGGYCRCNERTGWTLVVEEGQATLRHSCGKESWLYREDIFADVPVTVTIDVCDDPGGWHGLERCDCGPDVFIEVAPAEDA